MKEQKNWKRQRVFLMASAMMTLLFTNGIMVSANYGQNAANWMLDQVFWVILVAVVIVTAMAAVKRNFTGALITVIVGAVVLYFVKNPTKLSDIGDTIMTTILK